MNCPICDYEKCDDFIIDLMVCNNCSHVFKKSPINKEPILSALHDFTDPIKEIRNVVENQHTGYIIQFEFPCMIFFGNEVTPMEFYDHNINQFFNQRSLIIFLKRCGLKITEQHNKWFGKLCLTNVKAVKE